MAAILRPLTASGMPAGRHPVPDIRHLDVRCTRVLRLAVWSWGGCGMDRQFDLGIDLAIRGLEAGCP